MTTKKAGGRKATDRSRTAKLEKRVANLERKLVFLGTDITKTLGDVSVMVKTMRRDTAPVEGPGPA